MYRKFTAVASYLHHRLLHLFPSTLPVIRFYGRGTRRANGYSPAIYPRIGRFAAKL